MVDCKDLLTVIDAQNAGYIGIDMLTKTNVGSLNPVKGWPVHWQEERRDENGNDIPTSVCNVAILREEAVVNEMSNQVWSEQRIGDH